VNDEATGLTTLTRLLPIACLAAAVCLFASELMTLFEFTPPGGEALDSMSNADRHGNAMFVIAVFAIGALGVAVFAGSKPAAVAVAVMGVAALLFFLLRDLPQAGQVGTLADARQSFFDAEAVPQAGFWMVLVSSLALSITGIALATLSPAQLAALAPRRWRERRSAAAATVEATPPGDDAVRGTGSSVNAHEPAASEAPGARLPRRPRTRQRG
jgi:hypothetical protein